jgi:hypothetical protein
VDVATAFYGLAVLGASFGDMGAEPAQRFRPSLDSHLSYCLTVVMKGKACEWDDTKAALNKLQHGVSFAAARGVFAVPSSIEFEDDRRGGNEMRLNTIGIA